MNRTEQNNWFGYADKDIQLLRSTDFAYLIGYLKITFQWPDKISHVAVFETIE